MALRIITADPAAIDSLVREGISVEILTQAPGGTAAAARPSPIGEVAADTPENVARVARFLSSALPGDLSAIPPDNEASPECAGRRTVS